MRYGTVVQFFPDKGFGFIRPDLGADIFFHISALGECETPPEIGPGQAVKYELEPRVNPKLQDLAEDGERDTATPEQPARPRAKLVELIDKIPGASLEETDQKQKAARHPRSRHKKPTWRR